VTEGVGGWFCLLPHSCCHSLPRTGDRSAFTVLLLANETSAIGFWKLIQFVFVCAFVFVSLFV
jgi:hypothetical protein